MGRLRVGILGAGWAGKGHAAGFARLPHVEVSAVWSRSRASAEALAASLDGPVTVFDDWRRLIEDGGVDIVSVAAPPMIRQPVFAALAAGRHVLVEKPLGVGIDDAKAIAGAARESPAVTACAFVWRYAPGSLAAWRAIREGRIGRISDIRAEWRLEGFSRAFFEQRPWVRDLAIGDGTLAEAGSHTFDQARFLTGAEFADLVCRARPIPDPADASFVVESGAYAILADMEPGVAAVFRFVITAGQGEWSMILNGEKGTLHVSPDAAVLKCAGEAAESLPIPEEDRFPDGLDRGQHCWNRLIGDFVAAIRTGEAGAPRSPLLATLDDGLRSQAVISASHLSERERRWVATGTL